MEYTYRCSEKFKEYIEFISRSGSSCKALVEYIEEHYNPKARSPMKLPKEHIYHGNELAGETYVQIRAKDMIKTPKAVRKPTRERRVWHSMKEYYPNAFMETIVTTESDNPNCVSAASLGVWVATNDQPIEEWDHTYGKEDIHEAKFFMIP